MPTIQPTKSLPHAAGDTSEAERNALICAAEAVASAGETDIFQVLVLGAARALDVELAFIGVLIDGRTDRIRTIAVCDRGEILDNFEYSLVGTPCENVVGQQFRYHAEGIQAIFPDPHVKAIGDDGPGIAPDIMERMFVPFFSTKEVGKGSGMGLAMVHGIVHEYGGHIRVDSQPGAHYHFHRGVGNPLAIGPVAVGDLRGRRAGGVRATGNRRYKRASGGTGGATIQLLLRHHRGSQGGQGSLHPVGELPCKKALRRQVGRPLSVWGCQKYWAHTPFQTESQALKMPGEQAS
jgi:hypothetical protein